MLILQFTQGPAVCLLVYKYWLEDVKDHKNHPQALYEDQLSSNISCLCMFACQYAKIADYIPYKTENKLRYATCAEHLAPMGIEYILLWLRCANLRTVALILLLLPTQINIF